MHSYLIVSKTEPPFYSEVQKIADVNKSQIIEFSVQKIDDARSLKSFLALSVAQKTLVVIKSFSDASEECANALLKSLEEPQDNVTFAIHIKSEDTTIPTIRSRCTIIRTKPDTFNYNDEIISELFTKDVLDISNEINAYKKREDAIVFSENILQYLSDNISNTHADINALNMAKNAIVLKKSLERNGNINLHFLRFISHIR